MGWVKRVARIREMRNAYTVLLGKLQGNRSLWRHRRRWDDDIKMYLKEFVCGYVDWINLAQNMVSWWTLVNTVIAGPC